MRLSLLTVGRVKRGPERELVERYRQRIDGLGRNLGVTGLEIIEFPESRARRDDDRRSEEAALILEKVGASALIVFDERGRSPSSEAFADKIREWRDEGAASVCCVIGGADGLDPRVLQQARLLVSFGALTIPHQIVRALVAEQLYRALTIIAGHPYHRAGHDDS